MFMVRMNFCLVTDSFMNSNGFTQPVLVCGHCDLTVSNMG